MAATGMRPIVNLYSTFSQRAVDQWIHDVALQNLPVLLCLDRSGIVGEDGATHHGVFDLSYLRCIPNLIIFAPRNEVELRNIMYTAQLGLKHPIAIRYPRGNGDVIDWILETHSYITPNDKHFSPKGAEDFFNYILPKINYNG